MTYAADGWRYAPVGPPPEQPAREGDGQWAASKPLTNQILRNDLGGSYFIAGIDVITESHDHFGKIAVFGDDAEQVVAQILTDHARAQMVPMMIVEFQLLRDTAFAFHVDEKHKPEAFATCQHHVCLRACETWNKVVAAARKAGVE